MKNSIIKRTTKQRAVILEELKKMKNHPTADKIYLAVRERLPKVSLGTIYRNLDILSELGEINKFNINGQWRYDSSSDKHHHIRCINCNRIDDIYGLSEIEVDNFVRISDYDVLDYKMEFEGICPDCKEKELKEIS